MSGGQAEGKGKKKKKRADGDVKSSGHSCLWGTQPSISSTSGHPSNLLVSALFFMCWRREKKKKKNTSQALFFWSCWTSPSWKGRTVCFSLLRRVTQNRVGLIRTCRDQEPTRAGESHWLHEVSHCFTARKSYLQPGWRSHQRIPTLSPLNFY